MSKSKNRPLSFPDPFTVFVAACQYCPMRGGPLYTNLMESPLPKKINALFIGNSYMNRQELIIPMLLKPLGYEFTVRTVYAPGQTFQGHLQNNAGYVTEAQKEGIERGRIGGWFSDDHCELLYTIARNNKGYLDKALAELTYDVAFILVSGGDCENPDGNDSIVNGNTILERVKSNNPRMRIVLFFPWTYLGRPEELPQFEWLGHYFALKHGCRLAPAGAAFRESEKQMPELFLQRSKKDSHQNEKSILLLAYTQICALLGETACALNFSVNQANPAGLQAIEEGVASSLDQPIDELFLKIARESTRQKAGQLKAMTLESLKRPVIVKPDTGISVFHADRRALVVGNSWFDADGAVWSEFANSYKAREEIDIHVETHTDDAATFQSILANNLGELTPRQRRIMETVGTLQAAMGKTKLDPDLLDGFGDYPVAMALARITDRKGKLDQALALEVKWDAILVQGFRGASDPGEDDFLEGGRALIAKIRAAAGDAPVFLMQHWAPKGAAPGEQEKISASYSKLGESCGVPVIPVGDFFAEKKNLELLSHGYTPNMTGVQLISETLRQYLNLCPIPSSPL